MGGKQRRKDMVPSPRYGGDGTTQQQCDCMQVEALASYDARIVGFPALAPRTAIRVIGSQIDICHHTTA